MSNKLLTDVGEALYGSRWQTDMASGLGVSDRTIRKWVAGDDELPRGVIEDLHRLISDRQTVLAEMSSRLLRSVDV